MTDIATGFLQAVCAFGATRLGVASAGTYHDARSLLGALGGGVPNTVKPAFTRLRDGVEADADLVKPIVKAIEKQTALIAKMAEESIADAGTSAFGTAEAGRIATRIGTALVALDEAVGIVATEVAKDEHGVVDTALREQLMGIWNPWVQPFKDLGADAGRLLDSFGTAVLDEPDLTRRLADVVTFDRTNFRLAATLGSTKRRDFGAFALESATVEAFLQYNRRTWPTPPTEAEKAELVEIDGAWWFADEARLGLRVFATLTPGLQQDALLKKVMPGSGDPKTVTPTGVVLDTTEGFSLGDGQGAGNEKMVLPVRYGVPHVEIREVGLGIVRDARHEVTGLELTSVVAATIDDVVGLEVHGVGATIELGGTDLAAAVFGWAVSPRFPDGAGIRVRSGPVNGGGYLQRQTRSYGTGADARQVVEYGGVVQLQILKIGVYAVGLISPDPFSLVLVMGVRFPVAIELSFGFTLNAVGGILAVDRRLDGDEFVKAMASHVVDRLLFPDDPVAEAPKLLQQVGTIFPPSPGGFVVGPILELGWGSQAEIVEAKLGIVLALPDPKLVVVGAVRVRAPSKKTPLNDLRCEVYGEVTADRLLVVARLRDSKIAGITVSGDLGLLIQWGGGGDFALSVGGFHPRYTAPPALAGLDRLTLDLSPNRLVKIIVKAYVAVTAGAVMAGVRGDLTADIGPASAHAWLQLDMIFRWVPTFGFEIDLQFGIDIHVFGHSFASVTFTGRLAGTTPWHLGGRATVDVWFLPTFHLDLGPFEWGDPAPAVADAVSPLALVAAALAEPGAWKAVLPRDGDALALLTRDDDTAPGPDGVPVLLAHPLAAVEVTQSRIPLETHLDRVGSAGVTAHRVHLGLASTDGTAVDAVSTVTAPFAPGQFVALEGEQLLGRSGFEQLPSGCRVAPSTVPRCEEGVVADLRWRTWFPDLDAGPDTRFDLAMFAGTVATSSVAARAVAARENPYLPRTDVVVEESLVLPAGTATVRRVDDATPVAADLGPLTVWDAEQIAAQAPGLFAVVGIGAR